MNVQTCKVLSISDVVLKHFRGCLRISGTTLVHTCIVCILIIILTEITKDVDITISNLLEGRVPYTEGEDKQDVNTSNTTDSSEQVNRS